MNAVTVAVNYDEELAVTLPFNRRHFDRVLVVTDHASLPRVQAITGPNRAEVLATDVFYAKGASFNKYAAVEQGLDVLGRAGLLAVMDCDVLMPARITLPPAGSLSTPFRRMCPTVPPPDDTPPEHNWGNFPRHPHVSEWSGYLHLFHADDPVLGPAPWYQTDWVHAGGADSFFQRKWPDRLKVRPDWEVLHLGHNAINWFGRASAFSDGTTPEQAGERIEALKDTMTHRRKVKDPNYRAERLS